MPKRPFPMERQTALDAGYRSVAALTPPRTEEEIATIVHDERVEKHRKQIEREAKTKHVARTLAKLRDQGR